MTFRQKLKARGPKPKTRPGSGIPVSQTGDMHCPPVVPKTGRLTGNSAENLSPESGMSLALIAAVARVGMGRNWGGTT